MNDDPDYTYMQAALEEANKAAARDEVPIGAVLVHIESGEIVARNGNRTRELNDPSAHAEVLVIREMCARVGDRIDHMALDRVTPLAAPLLLEPGRVPIRGTADERLLEEEVTRLLDESGLAQVDAPKTRAWRVPY